MKYLKHCFQSLFHLSVLVCFSSANAGAYEDFFLALERNEPRSVLALLQRGFDPNTRNPQAQPALTRAIQAGSLQVVDVLLASPDTQVDISNEVGETPLMMAALKGQAELSQRLLAAGAKPHRSGWAPIHYAATGPDSAIVALLLDRGAPIDAVSPTERTPLMMAALYGPEESVRLLLKRGADPRLRTTAGQSAADFARASGRERLARELDALMR
jgi:ankyrin repeat protein